MNPGDELASLNPRDKAAQMLGYYLFRLNQGLQARWHDEQHEYVSADGAVIVRRGDPVRAVTTVEGVRYVRREVSDGESESSRESVVYCARG